MQSIGTCRFQLLSSSIFRKQTASKHRHPQGVQTFRQFMSETPITTYERHSQNSRTLKTYSKAVSGFPMTETTNKVYKEKYIKTQWKTIIQVIIIIIIIIILLLLLLLLSIEFNPTVFSCNYFPINPVLPWWYPKRGRSRAALFLVFVTRQRGVMSFTFHLLYSY